MNNQRPEPKVIAEGKFFRFMLAGTWEFIEPKNFTGASLIVPVTDDGRVVLIEQYRTPVDAWVIEIPAGLVGDEVHRADENPQDGARRELLEETGYLAERMEPLAEGTPSAGSSNVMLSLFKATGLRKIGPGGGDHTEDIRIHEVPVGQVRAWLEARRGEGRIIDLKVYAGLWLAGLDA